ncbi:hypothetical protein [Ideonella sp.]|uniref:hypothetical protein n=1 Tax=Ideonella sp. TaxID=1929293 RepID=UPI003BB4D504
MSIELTIDGVTHALPDALQWADEYAWSPVVQQAEYSLTGALLVDAAVRQAGRPITLGQPAGGAALITRSVLDALYAAAAAPGLEMTLTLRSADRTVQWRHQDGDVIAATPLEPLDDVQPDDLYTVTLKFMEV